MEEKENIKTVIIEDFAEAWRSANPELIINHLSAEFVYDSQWVFALLNYREYVDYVRGKFQTLKKNNCIPLVKIVNDTYYGGKMLELMQGNEPVYYRIRIENDKVVKGDLCMF